jgi:hypothetical protein
MLLKKVVLILAVHGLSVVTLGQNALHYLELRDIGATPAEIILSPDYQTIIEFEGLRVDNASSGRADQITVELDEETIRLRANQDVVSTDLTVKVGGETALFTLRSDPATNAPRRYVVRNSPPPPLTSLGYKGIEGKTDLNALEVGTKDLPPGVTLDLTATMDNRGDVALQYVLANDGEVSIVNEPSRLNVLNEDIKLRYTLSRVPPAGSVNVIAPGESEHGTIIVPDPPNGQLTFLWILVQLGPGGHYAATVDISSLLDAPQGTSATIGTPAPEAATPAPEPQAAPVATPAQAAATTPADISAAQRAAGVTLYEHSYSGASVLLTGTDPITFYRAEQGQFGAVPDNSVSSLVVPEGYTIILCDVQATLPCQQYGPGTYDSLSPELNDKFSFAEVFVTSSMATTQDVAPSEVPAPSNLVLNPGFDGGDISPWWFTAKEEKGAKAQGSLVEGSFCTNITAGGQDYWDIGLGQNDLRLELGHSYALSFDAKAERVSQLAVELLYDIEPRKQFFYQTLAADAGAQHFEYKVTASETTNIILNFKLGGTANQVPTTICIDNVALIDTTDSTPQADGKSADSSTTTANPTQNNLIADPGFDNSTGKSWWLYVAEDKGAKAQGNFVDGGYCVNITANGQAGANITLGQGTPKLEANHSYMISFEATSERLSNLAVTLRQNGEPWTQFFHQALAADAGTRHFDYTVTMPETTEKINLAFELEGSPDQTPSTICFDNIALVDTTVAGGQASDQPAATAAITETPTEATAAPITNTPDLSGTYALVAGHSSLCVEVVRFNQDNGALIAQWTCNEEINQRWTLGPQGDFYKLSVEHSHKCLDVDAASLEDGGKVHQWECVEVENQLWSLKQVPSGYQIVAKHSGKCLAVLDASVEKGAGLIQWTCSSGDVPANDTFALSPLEPAPPAPEANLAQGKTTTASSVWQDPGYDAAKATDGDPATIWSSSGDVANHWLQIDLGQAYTLSTIELVTRQDTDQPETRRDFEIRVANNPDMSDQKVLCTQDATELADKSTFTCDVTDTTPYRYVIAAKSIPDYFTIAELLVYGSVGETPTAPAATATAIPLGDNLLVNSGFDEPASTAWTNTLSDGARGVAKIIKDEYCFNVLNGGTNFWSTRLNQAGFALEPGQSYVLSFEAYADQPRTIFTVAGQDFEPWTPYKQAYFTVQETKQTYTFPFTMVEGQDPASYVQFSVGGNLAANPPFRMCFDNVVLQKGNGQSGQAVSEDLLGNPSFDDATSSLWNAWFNPDSGSQGLGEVRNGEFCTRVEKGGTEVWAAQIYERGFLLEPGDYTLSFEAYADQPHTILSRISQGYEPWASYKEQMFDIGTQKQPYTMLITLEAREANASAEFWFGGDLATNPPFVVCLDNIVLKPKASASQ